MRSVPAPQDLSQKFHSSCSLSHTTDTNKNQAHEGSGEPWIQDLQFTVREAEAQKDGTASGEEQSQVRLGWSSSLAQFL